MQNPKAQIRSGVFWLGSANLAAQVLDAASLFVVLAFLSQEDLGVATLAWSLAVILESLNGLGTGSSLLQAQKVSKLELGSLFWFAIGSGVFFCAAMSLVSPWIAAFYGNAELAPMIVVSALKLPIVSAALVPLQLLNRELKFRDIALIQAVSTLLSSVLKIALSVAGMGAWALVWANTAFGVFTLCGALLRHPFAPGLGFAYSAIRDHVRYGLKISVHTVLYHGYRNADFLIVGRMLGNEALGLYRVAFDLAMTPAQAMQLTVGRALFPVFTRMLGDKPGLAAAFVWTQRGLAFVAAAIAVFLTLGGRDVLRLVGSRWEPALPALAILAWAAVLRSVGQLFPELYKALGKPGFAVIYSLLACGLLIGGFLLGLWLFPEYGVLPVAWTWLAAQPVTLFVLLRLARKLLPLGGREFLRAFAHPAAAALLAALAAAPLLWLRARLPDALWLSWAFVIALAAVILLVFFVYLRRVLGLTFGDLIGRSRPAAAPAELGSL